MCRLGTLKRKSRYMVEENHEQPLVDNGNEYEKNDCVIENIEKELSDKDCKVKGERVRCSLELSSQKKLLGTAQAMFYRAFALAQGNVKRLDPSWQTIQVTVFANTGDQRKSEVAAKFVRQGEGRANEGWTVYLGILSQICTHFDEVLFGTLF